MSTEQNITALRAALAARREDLRIARNHRAIAAGRINSPANCAAYERALAWEFTCEERARDAQRALFAIDR